LDDWARLNRIEPDYREVRKIEFKESAAKKRKKRKISSVYVVQYIGITHARKDFLAQRRGERRENHKRTFFLVFLSALGASARDVSA
jgi:hypothetical protein